MVSFSATKSLSLPHYARFSRFHRLIRLLSMVWQNICSKNSIFRPHPSHTKPFQPQWRSSCHYSSWRTFFSIILDILDGLVSIAHRYTWNNVDFRRGVWAKVSFIPGDIILRFEETVLHFGSHLDRIVTFIHFYWFRVIPGIFVTLSLLLRI